MDKNFICPKCGQRAWKMTKKKNKIKCTAPYCTYVSEEMTEEKINEVLNYVPIPPTPLESCIEEINKESVWIDEYGVGAGDYINLNVLKEILKKYIKKIY